MIDLHGWKEALVVYSEQEAIDKGLEIDHDDTHAAFGKENFALLIHGTQPKGSAASRALSAIKKKEKDKKRGGNFGAPAAGFNYEMNAMA
jgi:UDP-N-acetylmuramoylalanine-D-glutamate ligase